MIEPFTNGGNGRGRVARRDRTASIRRLIQNSVSDADLTEIVESLVESAKLCDVKAARELLDRLIGKPGTYADLELVRRLDLLEARLAESERERSHTR